MSKRAAMWHSSSLNRSGFFLQRRKSVGPRTVNARVASRRVVNVSDEALAHFFPRTHNLKIPQDAKMEECY
jgi:hypothetical protein